MGITIDIRLKTKGLENVELFVNGEKNTTLFSECILVGPGERNFFEAEYTPTEEGKYEIKAMVTADDGTQYEPVTLLRGEDFYIAKGEEEF